MSGEAVQRRLAAILAADIVGYSRLMAADEVGTLQRLKVLRADVLDPLIASHGGRLVKLMGDGSLVEFSSAVDAVRCALAIQEAMASYDAELDDLRRLRLRIGINLGDVVIDGDDIYGDGVNIAARLEQTADPGGIRVSELAYRITNVHVDRTFEDMGECQLKNMANPVRVWRWPSASTSKPVAVAEVGLPLPNKPSIAVLPFDNLSADPEQQYFVDGMTEDIITDLSRLSGLFVIARHSSFQYRGRNIGHAKISRELGVRYLLEGSVRRIGNRLRTNAQLIDAVTGYHLWAERFDNNVEDLFDLQDQLTKTIVGALELALTGDERRRLRRRETASFEAYDFYLQAKEHLHTRTRVGVEHAMELLQRAISLDPVFSLACAELANCHHNCWVFGWRQSEEALAVALSLGERSVEIDPASSLAHIRLSSVLLFRKEHDKALEHARRSVAMDPNFAEGLARLGHLLDFSGEPAGGIVEIDKAIRLDPIRFFLYPFFKGHAYFSLGDYDRAIDCLVHAMEINYSFPGSHLVACATFSQAGMLAEARREATVLKRLSTYQSRRWIEVMLPHRNRAVLDRLLEGLREAGIPE